MIVKSIPINWHINLPVFACERFLKAVGDEYGWLGGFSKPGEPRCVLPYTIIRRSIFRMVRFRIETIPLVPDFKSSEEKVFLNEVVHYFRDQGVDMIIPASTNTIFRTYPDGADAAPYGSYVIDLSPPEETLWMNMDRILRQNIKSAIKSGIVIREAAISERSAAYPMIRDTFKRSGLPFMDAKSFENYLTGIAEFGKLLVADLQGTPQSFCVFAYSDYCAYAIYAGNVPNQIQGANKLLYWEAIRMFKNMSVRAYDFVGARINPSKGSKQEALGLFKRRFGATLKQGYMWKYRIRPLRYLLYGFAVRIRSGGDIVDAERHKLESSNTSHMNR
jgi:hypothetical protein